MLWFGFAAACCLLFVSWVNESVARRDLRKSRRANAAIARDRDSYRERLKESDDLCSRLAEEVAESHRLVGQNLEWQETVLSAVRRASDALKEIPECG